MRFLDRIFGSKPAANSRPAPAPAPELDLEGFDERAALLFDRWPEAQRREYARLGRPVLVAALALDEGRVDEARSALESLYEAHPGACFLVRDVGRARLAAGELDRAEAALRSFLGAEAPIPDDVRFETHLDLVRIANERGDLEGAIEELSSLLEALPEQREGYLLLGRTLRLAGHLDEALDVLAAALALEGPAPSPLLEELGIVQLALGRTDEAESTLDEVVRRAKCGCGARIPEATALALATIYESTGRDAKARELRASIGRAACASH